MSLLTSKSNTDLRKKLVSSVTTIPFGESGTLLVESFHNFPDVRNDS